MPAYNAANYVGEAIQSVVAQTFRDWELIVVDDASTNDTAKVVQRHSWIDLKSSTSISRTADRVRRLKILAAI